jgi:hypothetical protein
MQAAVAAAPSKKPQKFFVLWLYDMSKKNRALTHLQADQHRN